MKKRMVGKKHGFYTARKTLFKAYNKSIDDKFLSKIKLDPPTNAGVKTVKNIKNSIGIKYTLLKKNFCGHVSYIHC